MDSPRQNGQAVDKLELFGLSRRSPLRGEWGGKNRKQTNMKPTIHEFADRLNAVASVRQPLPSGWFGDGSPLATEVLPNVGGEPFDFAFTLGPPPKHKRKQTFSAKTILISRLCDSAL